MSTTKSPPRDERSPEPGVLLAVGAALGIGVLLRAVPVLSADFPLNDGGLFLVVVEDLRRGHYAPPDFISYNGTAIPFVYPPLAFYIGALVTDLAQTSVTQVLRLLPLAVNILTLGAFFALARAVLPSKAALAATAIFAVLPGSFFWLVMGGGLTRSFGFLFAILGLRSAYCLYTGGGPRAAGLFALFAALTLLTHLSMAWFLAFSAALVFLGYGRHRRAILSSLAVAAAALALATPWWATALVRHGFSPFLAASGTSSLLTAPAAGASFPLPGAVLVGIGLVVLAAAAGMAALGDRRFFILGWIGSMFILDIRTFGWMVSLPLALADGYLVVYGLLPALRSLRPGIQAGTTHPAIRASIRRAQLLTNTLVATILVVLTELLPGVGLGSLVPQALVALSPEEREAMRWIGEHTPAPSTFLVLSGDVWAWDRSAEWFPVLARRVSVSTAQGLEWVPEGAFARRRESHEEARSCASEGASCLDRWSASTHLEFTHVYLPKRGAQDCCAPLRASLSSQAAYEVAYDGPGATIFARR